MSKEDEKKAAVKVEKFKTRAVEAPARKLEKAEMLNGTVDGAKVGKVGDYVVELEGKGRKNTVVLDGRIFEALFVSRDSKEAQKGGKATGEAVDALKESNKKLAEDLKKSEEALKAAVERAEKAELALKSAKSGKAEEGK